MSGEGVKLTEDQFEVLDGLDALGPGFWRPLDFGGHDGSHHSATAARLCSRGLVQRRDRQSLAGLRPVWLYCITEAGRDALKAAGDRS